jgi:ribosomal 50S subunit-recycling heat shock protein
MYEVINLMRLDKYLKVSRIIKRRTIANEACTAGRVIVNSNPAKAGYEVKVGDKIEIKLGAREIKIEVISLKEFVKKEEAASMYKLI